MSLLAHLSAPKLTWGQLQNTDVCHDQPAPSSFERELDESEVCDKGILPQTARFEGTVANAAPGLQHTHRNSEAADSDMSNRSRLLLFYNHASRHVLGVAMYSPIRRL